MGVCVCVCVCLCVCHDNPPGPSAVGRAGLMRRLVSEYPDKFGLTVSHTSRPPREHEVHGTDYLFTSKNDIRALAAKGDLLEIAPIERTEGGPEACGERASAYLYATSITTVREVAATGKLCVMAVDEQGVEALQVGTLCLCVCVCVCVSVVRACAAL